MSPSYKTLIGVCKIKEVPTAYMNDESNDTMMAMAMTARNDRLLFP